MLHDASGLKHLGVGPGWVWLGDRSKPEVDRVITDPMCGPMQPHVRIHMTPCVDPCDPMHGLPPLTLPTLLLPCHVGKDRGPETPGGSQVRVPTGRGRGMDIRTPGPPRGTLNVHAEFHFFPACWGMTMASLAMVTKWSRISLLLAIPCHANFLLLPTAHSAALASAVSTWTVRIHPHLCPAAPISIQTTHIIRPVQPDPPDPTGLRLILFMDSHMFYNRMFLHMLSSSTFYLHLDPRSSILISVTYPHLSDSSSH